jgi:hypothetical protein
MKNNLYSNYDIAYTKQQSFGIVAELDGYPDEDGSALPIMHVEYDSDHDGKVMIHVTDSEGKTSTASFDTQTLIQILNSLSF